MTTHEPSEMVEFRGVPRVPAAVVREIQWASTGQLLRMLDALVRECVARDPTVAKTVRERVAAETETP